MEIWKSSYMNFNMDPRKCSQNLILTSAIALWILVFVFLMDGSTTLSFFSFYSIRFIKNFTQPSYKKMFYNNSLTVVTTEIIGTPASLSLLTTLNTTPYGKSASSTMKYTFSGSLPKSTPLPSNQVNTTYYLCPSFLGGLGNHLFIFATHFGAAMSKGMTIAISKDSELYRVFRLNVFTDNITHACKNHDSIYSKMDCAFDEKIMLFSASKNIRLGNYLQSWKYFYTYRDRLRKELIFRPHVQSEANKMLNKELNALKIKSRKNVVLIGVHIRRGDMVNHSFGYNVATPEYLSKAVQYFKNKYKNTVFIVSSLDLKWARSHFPKNTSVRYVHNDSREVIVALLSSCDHTITTVGSFGWWIGWLTGGDVTYYKWPAKEGSELRKQFSKDFSDYFYPGWIGM